MVPGEPTQACGRAAKDPQRQAPGPLPVLRTTHELQKPMEVLSGGLQNLAEVAQSPNAREGNAVDEVYGITSSPSLVASVDHPFLELCGESRLRNPLRGNLHGGVCEGRGRWCCYGQPNRARSWKRRTQPRNAYSAPRSLLLGEIPRY